MLNQIYAIKQRMSQEFLAGARVPVTSLLVPEHQVVGEKTSDRDGYRSLIIALGQAKKVGKKPRIKEIKLKTDETAQGNLQIETLITPNSLITVSGKSKGKGFAGVMKRWNFRGGPRTHGQSDRQRTPGSIGRGTTPGRILPGKKMPGRMGGANISTKNLTVLAYDPATRILKVKGAIPGAINAFVTIKITHLAKLDQLAQ